MLDFFPKTRTSDVFRKFLVYFSAGLLVVLVLFGTIAHLEQRRVVMLVAENELDRLRQAQNLLSHKLNTLVDDLKILAGSDALGNYLESPSPASQAELVKRMRYFVEDKGRYDRVSFLSPDGRELASFERGWGKGPVRRFAGKVVGETSTAGMGDIVLSVSDDQGGREVSLIRLSSPVIAPSGARGGTILLECPASRLFDHLSELNQEEDGSLLFVADQGGNPLPTGMPEEKARSLAAERPELWQALRESKSGQLFTAAGLFTYARTNPAAEIGKAYGRLPGQEAELGTAADEWSWYMISHTPAPELFALRLFRQGSHSFWLIPLALVGLAAGSLHLAINRANKERSERAVELLSTAIEQSPAAALITDSNGLIQYANPKFLAMSGYRREEIVGQNPRVFKSGETPEEIYRDLWQTVRAGRVWTGEFLNRRKDQTHYVVAAKISPILLKSGVISGYLAIQEDITETRRLQQQLERLATVDGLTGTYNRSHFLHLFNQELRREERYGMPLCLLVFDLDHFKAINDTYGHQIGDQVLEEFARIVDVTLRDTDIFGRLGGEEFGVVLPQTDHEGAMLLAERLRAAVEGLRVTCEGEFIPVTVSIGGTRWEREDGKIEVLLNRADNALYEAKRKGRNQVCFRFAGEGSENNSGQGQGKEA